jgi:hypothetical protein
MESKIGILFCGSYDYKFNHLMIVTHFIGSCLSGRSFKSQTARKSGTSCEISTMDLSSLILYLCITTRSYGASKIDHLERMQVVLILYYSVSVDLNTICGLFIREDSTVS